ncbi:MAG: HpcH/HpaI aldolase family protein [Alphaproteobacteria bacterium]|jgi:2-keto-3-deoxy-L-rhamnonate aldolase RhmA
MSIIPNHAKEKMKAGELALGFGVRNWRSVDIAKIAKVCGFDWLFIDLEHSTMTIDQAVEISIAALDVGITPIPRASAHERFQTSRPLDGGAQGIVVPHVDTVEEAKRVVDQALFPPMGHRSITGVQPILSYGSLPIAELTKVVNDNLLVTVMLETPTAIANADAIAAVPGVDCMLIGTNDLCAEMGIHGQYGHENVAKAYDTAAAAARNNGKFLGMGGVYDEDLAAKYIKAGAQMILSGQDLGWMMQAAKARSGFLRSLQG